MIWNYGFSPGQSCEYQPLWCRWKLPIHFNGQLNTFIRNLVWTSQGFELEVWFKPEREKSRSMLENYLDKLKSNTAAITYLTPLLEKLILVKYFRFMQLGCCITQFIILEDVWVCMKQRLCHNIGMWFHVLSAYHCINKLEVKTLD